MTEIVSLLSSSPRLPTPAGKNLTSQSIGIERSPDVGLQEATKTHIDSDSFETSIFDDLWFSELEPQPSKRRRLSPEQRPRPKNSTSVPHKEALSLLLSDHDDNDLSLLGNRASLNHNRGPVPHIWEQELSDPIIFTSSAPEPRTSTTNFGSIRAIDNQENDGIFEEHFSFSQPTASGRGHLSQRTTNLLSNIEHIPPSQRGGTQKHKEFKHFQKHDSMSDNNGNPTSKTKLTASTSMIEEIFGSSPPQPLKGSKGRRLINGGKGEREERAQERVQSKAQRDKHKEEEKERKKLERDRKAREKQLAADVAEVNKSKADKKTSTLEMIVDMAESLQGTSVGNQVAEFMKRLDVELNFSGVSNSPGNLIHWRRRVTSRFDEELGHWLPAPESINTENHVLVYLLAQEFVDLATNHRVDNDEIESSQVLRRYALSIKQRFLHCEPIFLIEGLKTWIQKNKNIQNRAYRAAVLAADAPQENVPPPSSQQPQSRKKKKEPPIYIDEDIIQDALLELQIEHGCSVHETDCATESAFAIKNFTEQISTIPYRQERMMATEEAAFCMDIGQVKTGDDVKDTYVKMLQEVQRVTPAMAYGIASKYPTVAKLVSGFKREGPDMLENVRKSANKNGAVSEGRLGSKVSRRLYKVYMGTNPSSTDGIA